MRKSNIFIDLGISKTYLAKRLSISKQTLTNFSMNRRISLNSLQVIFRGLKNVAKDIEKLTLEDLIKLSYIKREKKNHNKENKKNAKNKSV